MMIKQIRPMDIVDYEQVITIWKTSRGIGLSAADSKDQIEQYFSRNPGFSFVALYEGAIIGAVLCGHDGRRGYIHHLAVDEGYQWMGIGRQLVDHCLIRLREAKIQKCHLFIFTNNVDASTFWTQLGFSKRADLNVMSIFIEQTD